MQERLFEEFQQVGEDLVRQKLTTTHGGNMSVRQAGRLIITAHLSMPGRLVPGDLVEVPLRENPESITSNVSNDFGLHQLIYKFTPAGAIIHAHPAHSIAMSLHTDMIMPPDLEGTVFLREIPVVAPDEAAEQMPQVLQTHVAVVVRGHGSYVVGRSLTEALAYTSALGLSCKIAYLDESLRRA